MAGQTELRPRRARDNILLVWKRTIRKKPTPHFLHGKLEEAKLTAGRLSPSLHSCHHPEFSLSLHSCHRLVSSLLSRSLTRPGFYFRHARAFKQRAKDFLLIVIVHSKAQNLLKLTSGIYSMAGDDVHDSCMRRKQRNVSNTQQSSQTPCPSSSWFCGKVTADFQRGCFSTPGSASS
ncbi:hypothetical protein VE01_10781 [Pseudogymnoascus verrucosus]|uniref:Uncharacterized protein n=1 Tax=Pseudogymnoascus verrucosus TaxID=342668 RepID=A0A2P6FGW6_9PEZI|nr:uncharacterized protein VE01_10781 [Pseudogymnoascus verrucosus]PQM43885.1 hypothetical protein VE01_10781 [Pseudogymnoascus verrucosus]